MTQAITDFFDGLGLNVSQSGEVLDCANSEMNFSIDVSGSEAEVSERVKKQIEISFPEEAESILEDFRLLMDRHREFFE